MEMQRLQITIQGQVQGVGFRPHVYRTANQLGLTGWVKNTAAGVLIEIQGKLKSEFLSPSSARLPPLAKIHAIQTSVISSKENEHAFEIIESEHGRARSIISTDTCICSDCLHELFDPKCRYYRYPFLNCTHCGPRLTITRNLPYDRCQTSMDTFPLCENCKLDYLNPDNRRYHAQPTACMTCGPQLSTSIDEIAKKILRGEIIALKGLGGYQLICDARNEEAILKLRARKNRDAKPFALMVANSESAKRFVEINIHEDKILQNQSRPIVLLRKNDETLPESIAPGLSHFGIMLPSTPLHYLLFNALAGNPDGLDWLNEFQSTILIVTSANPGGNPLVVDDNVAHSELCHIADKIVEYNRQIITRVDDSLVHIINNAPFFIRRARG